MDVIQKIDQFIGNVDKAEDIEEVFGLLRQYVGRIGFPMYTYWLMVSPDSKAQTNPLWVTSYPEEWAPHYLENDYGADDLVVRNSALSTLPFLWTDLNKKYQLSERQRLVFNEGAEVGIRAGGTVPIHGPGQAVATFSVANDNTPEEFQKLFNAYRHELHLVATYAHERLIALGIGKESIKHISLTAREIEILTWAARGKTRWEISQILSISEETVKTHIMKSIQKLGVSNSCHAISRAVIYGIIQP